MPIRLVNIVLPLIILSGGLIKPGSIYPMYCRFLRRCHRLNVPLVVVSHGLVIRGPVIINLDTDMKCTSPLFAWPDLEESGLLFNPSRALKQRYGNTDRLYSDMMVLPCGKCLNCIVAKRQELQVRLAHELQNCDASCFITLTYNDDNLPKDDRLYPILVKRDAQNFLKRLRRKIEPLRIRYFLAGEYGEKSLRPHYHVIIYGWQPEDLSLFSLDKFPLYRSDIIESCWTLGFSLVGASSTYVASYASRYTAKKSEHVNKKIKKLGLPPMFFLQSKMQGALGYPYFARFKDMMLEQLSCRYLFGSDIRTAPIPKSYLRRVKRESPEIYEKYKNSLDFDNPLQYNMDKSMRRSRFNSMVLNHMFDGETI